MIVAMMRMNMEGDSHVGESHVQAAASAVIVELRGSVRYDIYSMIPKYYLGFMCLPPLHSLGQSEQAGNKRQRQPPAYVQKRSCTSLCESEELLRNGWALVSPILDVRILEIPSQADCISALVRTPTVSWSLLENVRTTSFAFSSSSASLAFPCVYIDLVLPSELCLFIPQCSLCSSKKAILKTGWSQNSNQSTSMFALRSSLLFTKTFVVRTHVLPRTSNDLRKLR
jgi:hypothetical protein